MLSSRTPSIEKGGSRIKSVYMYWYCNMKFSGFFFIELKEHGHKKLYPSHVVLSNP